MKRGVVVICLVASLGVVACSGSDDNDDEPPGIGGIDGPAVVDPSFDPFVTDPSAPPVSSRD